MIGVTIRTNARHARQVSALVSPSRSFEPTGERGVYFMEAANDVQALRDYDFIVSNRIVAAEATRLIEEQA